MNQLSYTLSDEANRTAKWLLEVGAVEFRPERPFTWTSGRLSPIYVDVRKVLGDEKARAEINSMACNRLFHIVRPENIDYVVGGETAGIPFAALIADRMRKPFGYVRKKPKGFGQNSQIECLSDEQLSLGKRIILVEDLCSDGGSKKAFIEAIRNTGNIVTDVFALYSYGCFNAAETLANQGTRLITLTDGLTLLEVADDLGWQTKTVREEIRRFLISPDQWRCQ